MKKTVSVNAEVHAQAAEHCREKGLKLGHFITEAIVLALRQNRRPKRSARPAT